MERLDFGNADVLDQNILSSKRVAGAGALSFTGYASRSQSPGVVSESSNEISHPIHGALIR